MTPSDRPPLPERPEDELSDGAIRDAIRATYDFHQRNAQRRTCSVCGVQRDVTHAPRIFTCATCLDKEKKEKDVTRVDGVPESAHGDLPQRPTR